MKSTGLLLPGYSFFVPLDSDHLFLWGLTVVSGLRGSTDENPGGKLWVHGQSIAKTGEDPEAHGIYAPLSNP